MQRVQADLVLNGFGGHLTGLQLHALCAGSQAGAVIVHLDSMGGAPAGSADWRCC